MDLTLTICSLNFEADLLELSLKLIKTISSSSGVIQDILSPQTYITAYIILYS